MKVIIVGAGDVGFVSAETIADVHDVLVIEKDEDIAENLRSRLNVAVLREDGTNPRVLRYAIETQEADVIVSTLHSDSENLFVCMMAKRIKPSIRTIATVDKPDYLIETSAAGVEGIDHIISPNLVTAEKMYRLCVLENAVEYETIKEMGVCVAVFKVEGHHQVVGRVVMHLPIPRDCTVFAMYRDDELITSPETMEIHSGDRLCVFGSEQAIVAFNDLMGVEEVAREFCILGGSVVGLNLAKMLSEDERKRYVKIIEKNPEVCKSLSRELSGVVVINADYTDPDIQYDENIFKVDSTVSTSSKDDTNLLICMSAKRHNANKVVARFFMREYEDIFRYTGLQTIIGFDRIIANEIIKCVVSDELAIARMQSSEGIFFTHQVDMGSRLLDRFVGDANMPEGLRVVAIRRGDSIIYPVLDTKVESGDAVIMFSDGRKESELIKVLGKGTLAGL
ncbi:MAG: NAD-binding protein [Thermoplasmata archaeon]|nr:NAD-binding protein [Thermoplasmata archaeon]